MKITQVRKTDLTIKETVGSLEDNWEILGLLCKEGGVEKYYRSTTEVVLRSVT